MASNLGNLSQSFGDASGDKSIMFKNLANSSTEDIFNKMLQKLEHGSAVEFQLPDWLNKSKPLPYTFIKRNVYRIKKVRRRIEDDGIFCSCSPSSGSSIVCGRDCHCGMLFSSCSLSCKCGNACLNKPFQNRVVKKMRIVKTEKCGLGLVADENIKQGEFVVEYVGEAVIDDKTCEERLWDMKGRGETNFYLCEINRDTVIDASYKGNKSRFINHSCQPNTEMQKWIIDGETRIGIFATHDIKRGEELTYDYQFVQFGADQDCYCGALGCRQKLGKPSKPKISSDAKLKLVSCEEAASSTSSEAFLYEHYDYSTGKLDNGTLQHGLAYEKEASFGDCIGKIVQIRRPHEDRCLIGCISNFNRSSGKHTIIFEDRRVTLLDMSKETWNLL